MVGGAYQSRYVDFSAQTCVNWYALLISKEEGIKTIANMYQQVPDALFTTPGLTTFCTPDPLPSRGMIVVRLTGYMPRWFSVHGSTLYEIFNNGSYTNCGTLTNWQGTNARVYMSVTMNITRTAATLFISDNNTAYNYDLLNNVLAIETSSQFPLTCGMTTTLDKYTFVLSSGIVYVSNIGDSANWQTLNLFEAGAEADPTLAIGMLQEEIYCFGSNSIEKFYNNGTTWSRTPKTTLLTGIIAPNSLAQWNGGFLFLGNSPTGGEAIVYMLDSSGNLTPVSPSSISWAINQAPTLANSYGFIQTTKDGHVWYYLTIPSLNATFVLDSNNNEWHERKSLKPFPEADGTAIQGHFRGKLYANFQEKNYFADTYSGKIFLEDFTNMTEDGNPIRRERTIPTFSADYELMSLYSLELDVNNGPGTANGAGSDPYLLMEVSKDGGNTFGNQRPISVGKIGKYKTRTRAYKLGTARFWAFRFILNDPVDLAIYTGMVNGTVTTSNPQPGGQGG